MQYTFNPINYCFKWTSDGWYEWDHEEAHRQALRERNARARTFRKAGLRVKCFTVANQLISRGGIGTRHPHIELWVNVYGLDAYTL